ncbi:MAG: GAF domain-containing sensor histidine kinase [Chloroflexi bacterium]|nr:GAF domain-containing sensor histidine kinase [Chloroflexota bacterium]
MTTNQVTILTRLLEVTRNLSTVTDLEAYLQSMLSAATELTASETASLLEFDEVEQEFFFRCVLWRHREALKDARVPLQGSAAGWTFQNAKALVIDDVAKDERHFGDIDELTGFVTRSMLVVSLVLRGKPIGALEVCNKAGGESYTVEDILILETLNSLATIAMQNDMLEASVSAAQSEARELDKLKNEFIAITSHELRTPLGLILGHATFLRELVKGEYHEQVDAIIRNAAKLKEIIESLSSVDNYQTGGASLRSGGISIAKVIEDVSSSFHDTAVQKGVALKVEMDRSQDLQAVVDANKISIVLGNLVKNAIAFTNQGGHVIVRGGLESGFVKVSVEDDGIGIPHKDLPRVFDRFYQVESHLTRRHGGMGLGLSVAKAMIEMHGGRIWAESMEGVGSIFSFLLPVEPKKAEADEARPSAA